MSANSIVGWLIWGEASATFERRWNRRVGACQAGLLPNAGEYAKDGDTLTCASSPHGPAVSEWCKGPCRLQASGWHNCAASNAGKPSDSAPPEWRPRGMPPTSSSAKWERRHAILLLCRETSTSSASSSASTLATPRVTSRSGECRDRAGLYPRERGSPCACCLCLRPSALPLRSVAYQLRTTSSTSRGASTNRMLL